MSKKELLKLLQNITEEKIPFNRLIGMKVEKLDLENIGIRFEMRSELVGNFTRGNLHGGVISTVLDVTGGMLAWTGIVKKMEGKSFEEIAEKFSNIGTIDLRVDYLRPGFGKYFVATGNILRTGNTLCVTRMELHNDEGILIAVGIGSYVIS